MDDPVTGPLRRAEDFEGIYDGTPPWDIGRPQPAFAALAAEGALRGRVLDIGCGTGEHALMAAAHGLDATGIDASAAAIRIARAKAHERGLAARFLVADALRLAELGERFETVLDMGLFHIFGDDDRRAYVESLAAATEPGGRCFMLCFSDAQPGRRGPRRVSQAEIRAAFARGWTVEAIEPARLELNVPPEGVSAWLARIRML